MTDITQARLAAFRLWVEGGCQEGIASEDGELPTLLDHCEAAFQAGVKAGLEAAAELCDDYAGGHYMAQSCAAAIRAIDPTSIKDTRP